MEDGEAGVSVSFGDRGDETKGESIGNYVDNLSRCSAARPAREGGGYPLAQALTRSSTCGFGARAPCPGAHMFRRRTTERLKKAVELALAAELTLSAMTQGAKKAIVGKRIACFWPMDDAWYTGGDVVDGKAMKHKVPRRRRQ